MLNRKIFIIAFFISALAGCGVGSVGGSDDGAVIQTNSNGHAQSVESPEAWGGDMRCTAQGCQLVLVEHELGNLVVYDVSRDRLRLVDKHKLAYHPDGAIWLNDNVLVAAVELTTSLEIFRLENGRLIHRAQVYLGFPPRHVKLISNSNGVYQLLATPYSGTDIAWVSWDDLNSKVLSLKKDRWCAAPWFPKIAPKIPLEDNAGLVVACRDDGVVLSISGSLNEPTSMKKKQLGHFPQVPSMVTVSPDLKWIYVALETRSKNARINAETGAVQWLDATPEGSVAVTVLPDETVVWAEDGRLKLDRYDADGKTLETRWHKTSGFSTALQLVDIDRDNNLDIIVLNSGGLRSDIIYGPLWHSAKKEWNRKVD